MSQLANYLCFLPRKAFRRTRRGHGDSAVTLDGSSGSEEKSHSKEKTMVHGKTRARGPFSFSVEPQHTQTQTYGNGPAGEYNAAVESLREREYPQMNGGAYLDHGGATIYANSLIQDFAHAMATNLYGNPHSENSPAKRSGDMVDACREKTLRFLGADPEHFDLIFVANATAGIKLVADCFRDMAERTRAGTFWYGYHRDCHTSLVGVRELTKDSYCAFENDAQVEDWLMGRLDERMISKEASAGLGLFAYPGQSNLNGRRLPKAWLRKVRENPAMRNTYVLFDAAALAMTSSLADLFVDPETAPDFTCLSFYKVFGFPDVGALVVRRDAGHLISGGRKYFGGGTISSVDAIGKNLGHRTRGIDDGDEMALHEGLEDGTLPFHSILALDIAIGTHERLYGSMDVISRHTAYLGRVLYEGIHQMRYPNGEPVVEIYADDHHDGGNAFGDATRQGATMAFNILRPDGSYVQWTEVEKLANEENVYIRAGGVCCPGGVYSALKYEQWEWDRMFSVGHRCSAVRPLINEKPTGVVRASVGAMSTKQDVQALLNFIRTTFADAYGRDIASLSSYSSDLSLKPTHRSA